MYMYIHMCMCRACDNRPAALEKSLRIIGTLGLLFAAPLTTLYVVFLTYMYICIYVYAYACMYKLLQITWSV